MDDQRIILTIGRKSEFPDAEVVARKLRAMVDLLQSLDRRAWQVGQPRYRWVICGASVSSPLEITIEAEKMNKDAQDFGAASTLVEDLRLLQDDAQPRSLQASDARLLRRFTGTSKAEREVPFGVRIPGRDATDPPTSDLPIQPKRLYKNLKKVFNNTPLAEEYISIEGSLRQIEAWQSKYHFILVERDTNREIDCIFAPADASILGEHVGHRLFAEGVLRSRGSRHELTVEAYQLIPRTPIPIEEVHRRGLRIPGGASAEDFVRNLRAQG